jgi:hypothetical protein
LIAAFQTHHLNIYVDQFSLIPQYDAAFASVFKIHQIKYFQAVLKVIRVLFVELSCIVSVSKLSSLNCIAVSVAVTDCVVD